MTSSQDVDLTAQLQSEDASQALAILFDQYADRIYRLAIGLVGDSDLAEDIVQDTFLAVMKRRMQFEGRSGLGTWLYRIAHNACIDWRSHPPRLRCGCTGRAWNFASAWRRLSPLKKEKTNDEM